MGSRRCFLQSGAISALALAAGCRPLDVPARPDQVDEVWHPPSGPGAATDEAYWEEIRKAFDLEPGLINLNNNGLSPVPRHVLRGFVEEIETVNRAPMYYMRDPPAEGREEESRVVAARMLDCDSEEVAITRSGTESLWFAQMSIPLEPGDEVLGTREEYWSSWNIWQNRVARDGITYREIDLGGPYPEPNEIVARFEAAMTPRTRVVSFSHIPWRTGHILPVREICQAARSRGIQTIVDGAQAVGHVPVRMTDLGCDIYATAGHKWLNAPLGTGLLYVRRDKIPDLWPPPSSWIGDHSGGNGHRGRDDIRKFELLGSCPPAPHNSIAEAVRFLETVGIEQKAERMRYLTTRWAERLGRHQPIEIVTDLRPGRSCGLASFYIEGIDSADVASRLLDEHRILVGPPVEAAWSGPPLVRITPNVSTTAGEIDRFADAVEQLVTD